LTRGWSNAAQSEAGVAMLCNFAKRVVAFEDLALTSSIFVAMFFVLWDITVELSAKARNF
jgi:hypothetical protein